MCSNKLLDKKVVTGPTVEPVSLADAKLHMNVDYTEKDTLITSLITAARQVLEDKYDIGIIEKDLLVVVDNSCGGIDLPGAPIGAITGVDIDGVAVTLTTIGESDKYIESPCSCYIKLSYKSGYAIAQVPEVYKTAIKEQVLWMFENLGDVETIDKICPMAAACLKPYRRNGYGVFL